jgi:hypothetical protein
MHAALQLLLASVATMSSLAYVGWAVLTADSSNNSRQAKQLPCVDRRLLHCIAAAAAAAQSTSHHAGVVSGEYDMMQEICFVTVEGSRGA